MTILDDRRHRRRQGVRGHGKEVGSVRRQASSQVSYINTLVQQRQDAILIAANDPNAVCGPLKQAHEQDIKVVTYDSDTAPECRDAFINQAGSEEIGRSQIQHLAKQLGHKGEIAILSATQNATNQNTWIEFMKDELKKPEYKDMKLVKVAYGDDDDQKSFQETQGLLKAYPNLKGIISPTTVGIAAAARYVSGSSYKGKVVLNGLGTPNQMRKYVKDGTVEQFALWDPKKLGRLGCVRRRGARLRARSPARRARSSRPATSASTPSARTARSSSARRPSSTRTTSTTSTSEVRRFIDAARLLSAEGPAGAAGGVPRAARGRMARDARRRSPAAGWHNYSLFLREDGLLVGYLETEDFAAAQAAMAATDVNARWQAEMAGFFEALDGATPDEAMRPLTEVFHLA